MDSPNNPNGDKTGTTVPEPETPPAGTEENGEKKQEEPQIPVQQVPMDGICGGY